MSALAVRHLYAEELPLVEALYPDGRALITRPGFQLTMCWIAATSPYPLTSADTQAVVARTLVEPRSLRYDRARLRAAVIGELIVEPGHYRRQCAEDLLAGVLDFVAGHGVHLALMHVPPGSSPVTEAAIALGFVPAWPYTLVEFDAREAAALPPPMGVYYLLRAIDRADLPALAALYDQRWEGQIRFSRGKGWWRWQISQRAGWIGSVVEPHNGPVRGYWIAPATPSPGVEIAADSPIAALNLVTAAARWHLNAGVDRVRWLLPPDDPLIAHISGQLDLTVSAHYPRQGGWLARVIDARGLIRAIEPEVRARIHARPLSGIDPAHVILRAAEDRLWLATGRREALSLAAHDFVALLFGAIHPHRLASLPGITPEMIALLPVLFPARQVALPALDWL
jgi:hypothetical protein